MTSDDPKEKLGMLARAAMLAQEKINDLKKKIDLLKTGSAVKTDMEKELSVLQNEQTGRLSEIDKVRQIAELPVRKPCFVQV